MAHIEALNNLGVVWCNRGEAQRALELLERAREAHAAVASRQQADGATPLDDGARVRLDDARTLSTYYLAQVRAPRHDRHGSRCPRLPLCGPL